MATPFAQNAGNDPMAHMAAGLFSYRTSGAGCLNKPARGDGGVAPTKSEASQLFENLCQEFFHLFPRLLVGLLVVLDVGDVMPVGIGICERMMRAFVADDVVLRAGIGHFLLEFFDLLGRHK